MLASSARFVDLRVARGGWMRATAAADGTISAHPNHSSPAPCAGRVHNRCRYA